MTTAAPGIASPGVPDLPGLPSRPRPQPPSPLTASAAFGWRALLKIKHVPEQLFDVIAIPVVFTLMFTYLFGGALAGSTRRYLQFILPGTLVMAVLLVSMYAGVGLNTDVSKGLAEGELAHGEPGASELCECFNCLLAGCLCLARTGGRDGCREHHRVGLG